MLDHQRIQRFTDHVTGVRWIKRSTLQGYFFKDLSLRINIYLRTSWMPEITLEQRKAKDLALLKTLELMVREWKAQGFSFRRRKEHPHFYVYTNDVRILEWFEQSSDRCQLITDLTWTCPVWKDEVSKLPDMATNVKLVRKRPLGELTYRITFSNIWRNDPMLQLIYDFVKGNGTTFRTTHRWEHAVRRGSLYGNEYITTDDLDSALMLHLIAPGKITNITKVMERTNEK
jgi:hypothetical protein